MDFSKPEATETQGCMFALSASAFTKAAERVTRQRRHDYVLVGMTNGDGVFLLPDGEQADFHADSMATAIEGDNGAFKSLALEGAVCVPRKELQAACKHLSGEIVVFLGSRGMRIFYRGDRTTDIASSPETVAAFERERKTAVNRST